MKPLARISLSLTCLLVSAGGAWAQDRLIPAGTLLECTMDEPNFSTATAAVGDPVLCHLKTLQEFGKPAFPRGAMLGGHLEESKDPGHFWGKGYLKISFERVILPYGDLPVPAKVILAKGYKVSKNGDINGRGHAKRDVAEWMLPPLWPWKVVSLPRRGPRPQLKGEEALELRLMDDISVPATLAYGLMKLDNAPRSGSAQPSALSRRREDTPDSAADNRTTARDLVENAAPGKPLNRFTMLVLKSDESIPISKFRIDEGMLIYDALNGTSGAVSLKDVDWMSTSQVTWDTRSAVIAEISDKHRRESVLQ
jgi:hypothetical protein